MDAASDCGVGAAVVVVVALVVVEGASGFGAVAVDGFFGAAFDVLPAPGVLWLSTTPHCMLNGRPLLPANDRHHVGEVTMM